MAMVKAKHDEEANRFAGWVLDQMIRKSAIEHLIKTLTSASTLSRTLSTEDATDTAKIIEGESYNAAIASANNDEIEILREYAQEICCRVLKTTKANQKEMDQQQPQKQAADDEASDQPHQENPKRLAFRPLTQHSRNVRIKRIIQILTSPSFNITKTYDIFPNDEATAVAKIIEEEAFSFAQSASTENDDAQKRLLQFRNLYSLGITRRIFKAARAKAAGYDIQDIQTIVLMKGAQVNVTAVPSSIKSCLDRSIPSVIWRWFVAFALASIFVLQIYLRSRVFVCFQFGMFFMIKFPLFISPIDDDEPMFFYDALLPKGSSDECKPFIRRCPEFDFWFHVMLCLCICIPMTFIDFWEISVHWIYPFLGWALSSFAVLKGPIARMIKYKYLPFNFGKQTYGKKPVAL